MALPFILSPYLRPFLSADGQRLYDNGVTGRIESVAPLGEEVMLALWQDDADAAEAALAELLGRHGEAPVRDAILTLYRQAILFESREHCEALRRELRQAGLPAVPFVDQVELTNRCPMRCPFCPRGVPGKMVRPTGFMDLALFRRLLAELHPDQPRYRPLELHHLGESLLHPQVADFVAAATAAGLPTEMSVNPSLLTPELGRALLAAGLGRLVLSLDGLDDETLVSLRGPAARYGKAERNLESLLATVAELGSAAPQVVIQMIALAANAHQREQLHERWGRHGLPTVQVYIKPLDGDDPALGRPSGEPLRYLCGYPFRSVVVLWDGRVVPCCRDDDARLVLGDLNTQSLAEIWNGPAARELRRRHRFDDFPSGHLCDGCAWSPRLFAAAHLLRHPARARPAPLTW